MPKYEQHLKRADALSSIGEHKRAHRHRIYALKYYARDREEPAGNHAFGKSTDLHTLDIDLQHITDLHASDKTHDYCSENVVTQCHNDCWLVAATTLLLKLPGIFNYLKPEIRKWILMVMKQMRPLPKRMPPELEWAYRFSEGKFGEFSIVVPDPKLTEKQSLRNQEKRLQEAGNSTRLIDEILRISKIPHTTTNDIIATFIAQIQEFRNNPEVRVILMMEDVDGFGIPIYLDDANRGEGEKAMTVEEAKKLITDNNEMYHKILRKERFDFPVLDKRFLVVDVFIEALRLILESYDFTLRGGILNTTNHEMPFTICDPGDGTHHIVFCNWGKCGRNHVPYYYDVKDKNIFKIALVIYGADEYWDAPSSPPSPSSSSSSGCTIL